MLQPRMGNAPDLSNIPWAADNDCFAAGDIFEFGAFLAWLMRRCQYRGSCLFAVAPDVLGDAEATWERSAPALSQIKSLGFKTAFVAQDGIERQPVDWDAFDVLFIGGSTKWKLSHHAREARRYREGAREVGTYGAREQRAALAHRSYVGVRFR